jgi:hypothetical protein
MSRRHDHEGWLRALMPSVRAPWRMHWGRGWRCGLVAVLLVLIAVPARADVVATAGAGARAGEGPASVAFVAEAESSTGGITRVETLPPPGVPAAGISLTSGPPGWTVTIGGDSYAVGGPPLAVGTDAEFTSSISQLPVDRTELTFRTLVHYSDGREDAWIEEATQDNPTPASPAPTITVAPVAGRNSEAAPPAPSPSAPGHAVHRGQGRLPLWVLMAGFSLGGGILAIGWAYARSIGPD